MRVVYWDSLKNESSSRGEPTKLFTGKGVLKKLRITPELSCSSLCLALYCGRITRLETLRAFSESPHSPTQSFTIVSVRVG